MKLQTAVVIVSISFLLLAAASVFYLVRKSEQESISKLGQLYTEGSGFLVSPEQLYTQGKFIGPSSNQLPVVNEYITGQVTNVIFTSSRFADYTEDYAHAAILTLTLRDSAGNTTDLTIPSPDTMLVRSCKDKATCAPFSSFNDSDVSSVQFSYEFPGTLKIGDSVLLYHKIILGNETDPVSIAEDYDIYVTRYEQ